jgi:hypothetical protein
MMSETAGTAPPLVTPTKQQSNSPHLLFRQQLLQRICRHSPLSPAPLLVLLLLPLLLQLGKQLGVDCHTASR